LHDTYRNLDRVLADAGRAAFKAGAAENGRAVVSLNSFERNEGLAEISLNAAGLMAASTLVACMCPAEPLCDLSGQTKSLRALVSNVAVKGIADDLGKHMIKRHYHI
jgi:hypothetical protein